MKKKLLAMVLAAATAMTMLAGCGGDKMCIRDRCIITEMTDNDNKI